MGEPYVPVAYSAETFRNKFLSIEDAMKRSEPQTIEVSNTANKIYSKIKDIHWPWDKDVLLLSIQTSIDNYNDYVKLHKKVLKQTDQKELKQFSRRFYEEIKDIEDFMVDWWGRVGRKISFISLPPSPTPFVFSIESKDFQSMGHMVSCKWSGDNDLWIEYRDLLYAHREKRSS